MKRLDKYKIVDLLAKKASRIHKTMMISQGFNPETGDLATFVEHCKYDETNDNIALFYFSASD